MVHTIKRRGLSDVVTTVLIILLVLAAVAIIWGYLRGALEQSGSQITSACLTLDLQPTSCNVSAVGATFSATVRYGRNSGEATLTNTTLVFTDAAGQSTTNSAGPIPAALETRTYTVTGLTSRPVSVAIAGTVRTEAGEAKLCDRSVTVQCT